MVIELRPDWDTYFMNIAIAVASRSTCLRRSVGAVLVDEGNHIIGTGYNGVAKGKPHCNYISAETVVGGEHYPFSCEGAYDKSGEGLDSCDAIHAEQNALLHCNNINTISKIYCTTSPCVSCTKLLLATSCKEIIFKERYPHWETSQLLWDGSGRTYKQL
jgi:dCMP deaminase